MPDFIRCFKYVAKYKYDILSMKKVWYDKFRQADWLYPLGWKTDWFLEVVCDYNISKIISFHNFTEYVCKWNWSVVRMIWGTILVLKKELYVIVSKHLQLVFSIDRLKSFDNDFLKEEIICLSIWGESPSGPGGLMHSCFVVGR